MTNTLAPGDLAYVTNRAVAEDGDLKECWRGVRIETISPEGVARVHLTKVIDIHISKLTHPSDPDAYDPVL